MSAGTAPMWVPTLGDLLRTRAAEHPDAPLLIFPDQRQSYRQMCERAFARASSLRALGAQPGDHIGILMPNCPEYIELVFAISLLGAVSVPMNARYKAEELAYVVDDADLTLLLTHDRVSEYVDFCGLLRAAFPDLAGDGTALTLERAPSLRTLVCLGSGQHDGFVDQGRFEAARVPREEIDALNTAVRLRDPVVMMYTSGTTANPKGCPLSHEALVRNGINMNRERYHLNAQDRFWDPLPMFHMSSILPLVACVDAGAALLSMYRFDADTALQQMQREQVTVAFPAFPTITNELINHPQFAQTDLSHLRRINNVAPVDMLKRFQAAFPQAIQTGAYGMTELAGVISFNCADESLEERLTTCGPAMPGIEAKIVDPDTLAPLPPNTQGEILVRGYCLFDGYYKSPEKNAEAFVDGWLRTGDLCSMDSAGRIAFHGRLKDMLKVGGENVAALEIEGYLATHPDIVLAQVIGIPDERLQEVPAAFIELRPGAILTEDAVINYCQGQIASFKVPRVVHFVTEWPMSSTKVQKFRLAQLLDAAD